MREMATENATALIGAAKENRLDDVERLLKEGADINATDRLYGQTAISWAAERGHLDVVKALYERKADLQIGDQDNWCPVDWAARNDEKDVVSFFLSQEQDGSQRYYKGRSLLFVAAQYGSAEDVKRFARRDDGPDHRDSAGMTPLMVAAENDRSDNAAALMEAGADPFLKDDSQHTAFYWAATEGHIEVLRVLMGAHADPHKLIRNPSNDEALVFALAVTANDEKWGAFLNAQSGRTGKERGNRTTTALHFAAKHGDEMAIRRVLPYYDSDVNTWDAAGRTPLIWASKEGHVAIVEALLKHGADAALADDIDNKTSLMWAAGNGHSQVVEQICRETDPSLHINARDAEGRTPLIWAAKGGHVAVVDTLLMYNADAALSEETYNETALMWAAENGHGQVVERLCGETDRNRHIDVRGWRGFTAMTFAAQTGNATSVSALIKAGADINVVDEYQGQTPLSWAAKGQHVEAVKALIAAGADLYAESRGRTPVYFAVRTLDILRAFLHNPRESPNAEGEKIPRVRAAELALRYFCGVDYDTSETSPADVREVRLILDNKEYLEAVDENGRNLVSWAAQGGRRDELEIILRAKQFDLSSKDNNGRNPLHWAAESGNGDVVEWLVCEQVPVDLADNSGRTPLSLAAGNGHAEVVTFLLSLRGGKAKTNEGVANRSKPKSHAEIDVKDGGALVSVDSRDVEERTPLWHAVTKHHLAVFKILRAKGANPGVKDRSGKSLQQILVEEKLSKGLEPQVIAALDATLEQLRSAQALVSEPLGGAADVDAEFKATVLRVLENEQRALETNVHPVNRLLAEGPPDPQGSSCTWMHLPANNVSTPPDPY